MPSGSDYDLLTEQRPGYIYARMRSVEMTRDIAQALLRDIRDLVAEVRAGRLLFEYELAHAMTDEETLDLVTQLMDTMPGMRIALVTADPRHLPALRLGTAIGLESGQEYASFTDPSVAEGWLLKD